MTLRSSGQNCAPAARPGELLYTRGTPLVIEFAVAAHAQNAGTDKLGHVSAPTRQGRGPMAIFFCNGYHTETLPLRTRDNVSINIDTDRHRANPSSIRTHRALARSRRASPYHRIGPPEHNNRGPTKRDKPVLRASRKIEPGDQTVKGSYMKKLRQYSIFLLQLPK